MEWFANALRHHPELALFLALALGYAIGRIKIGGFQVGAVIGVLIAGVVIGQFGIKVSNDLNGLRKRSLKHFRHFHDERVHIDGLSRDIGFTGKREDLPHKASASLDRACDSIGACGKCGWVIFAARHERKMAQDNPKYIVEIVCDSSCKGANPLHLLCLNEFFLKSISISNIVLDRNEVSNLSVIVLNRRDRHFL